jgi:hypothetical protein
MYSTCSCDTAGDIAGRRGGGGGLWRKEEDGSGWRVGQDKEERER